MATDEQAANANSYHCPTALRRHGIDAPLAGVGDGDDLAPNRLDTAATVSWFLQLHWSATRGPFRCAGN